MGGRRNITAYYVIKISSIYYPKNVLTLTKFYLQNAEKIKNYLHGDVW